MGEGILIPGFHRASVDNGGALYCEGVPVEQIGREVGTPVYIYSAAMIRDRYASSERCWIIAYSGTM